MPLTPEQEQIVQSVLKSLEPIINQRASQLTSGTASEVESAAQLAANDARQKRAERIRNNGKKLMER